MEQTQKFTFLIYPHDVDNAQNFRLVALESYILNAAGLAAAERGFGSVDMLQKGVTWVLSRLAIEMIQQPKQYEHIIIETWVEDCGRLFTTRNFKIYNQENQLIGNASSLWALIDVANRTAINLQTIADWQKYVVSIPSAISKPSKISTAQGCCKCEHVVKYSDIDFNKHTNSAKYVEWMLDAYSMETICECSIMRFEVNYLHEALLNERVYIHIQDLEKSTLFSAKSIDGKEFCKMKINWVN